MSGFIASVIICIIGMNYIFQGIISFYLIGLTILFSFHLSIVGIRVLAKIDYNSQSAINNLILCSFKIVIREC